MELAAPTPSLKDDEFLRHRQQSGLIARRIQDSSDKRIPFSEFLNLALYEPNWGYYTSNADVIGVNGDYITAPELGDAFGKCLARKIADTLSLIDEPHTIFEFGAGSGKLALQILKELKQFGINPLSYSIVEISPVLQARQRRTLSENSPAMLDCVTWLDSLPEQGLRGVIVANEVLDALPFELLQVNNQEILQGYTILSTNGFVTEFQPEHRADFASSLQSLTLPELVDGYVSELHCQAEAWVRTVSDQLEQGSIIIIDYGYPEHEYYHPERTTGTLACFRRHEVHFNPYINIGYQDISTHVNFTAIARVACTQGMNLNGFTSLGAFLLDAGLLEYGLDLSDDATNKLKSQVLTLTNPTEMGERFKVMELTKNIHASQTGFRQLNQIHRLNAK